MSAILCSFSGAVADLPPKKRDAMSVLAVLAKSPRVSCFDLSEYRWLNRITDDLVHRGYVVYDAQTDRYPWCRFRITEAGQQALATASSGERREQT